MFWNSNRTFKPSAKPSCVNKDLSNAAKNTMATLGAGNLANAVKLPQGENLNEWLAVNMVEFFNELNIIYGTIADFCTNQTCPIMAGPKCKYLWMDGVKVKKPLEVSAPDYVDYLMTWAESQLNDESVFPIGPEGTFPKDFKKRVAVIFKRFFRVYAHIYHAHLKQIEEASATAHLNTCFKHFIYFVLEFELVEKAELQVLQEVIDNMLNKDQRRLLQDDEKA